MITKHNLVLVSLSVVLLSLFAGAASAQKKPVSPQPAIFAVLYNGGTLEPIAVVEEGGKLVFAIDGGSDPADLKAFHSRYFRSGTKYPLIFGGASAGTVSVKSADPRSECQKHTAAVTITSAKAKIRGNVMGLATNLPLVKPGSGLRRVPTAAERTEIEALVRAEFRKQNLSSTAVNNVKSQNLTAIDIDNDGSVELVGSYWAEPDASTRGLLFFIAEKDAEDKLRLGYSEFATITEENTMSGDISDIDRGVYHELFLDSLDIDRDGVAEIFTFRASFEGSAFNAYRRQDGKWVRIFEGSNYRCAY